MTVVDVLRGLGELGEILPLIADLFDAYGKDDAIEILRKLVNSPAGKADLTKLDQALADWRAAHAED